LKKSPTVPVSEPSSKISPAAPATPEGISNSDELSSLEYEVEELKQEFEALKNALLHQHHPMSPVKKHLVHLQRLFQVATILAKNFKM
jgi:hypothetical protein